MSIDAVSSPAQRVTRDQGLESGTWWRWLKRVLIASVLLSSVVATAVYLPDAVSTAEPGPRLTHTVTRRDLVVTITEQGTLESSENTEIKCQVRGQNTVTYVVPGGTIVEKGDLLVKLDTLFIEEAIDERTKYAHWSRSGAERSRANVARATLAIKEYEEGRFKTQLMTMEKDLAIAESRLRTSKNMLRHSKKIAARGFQSKLEVEQKEFEVVQGELNLELLKKQLDVFVNFTKAEQLETLKGNLAASTATHHANVERAYADGQRRQRALDEYKLCEIRAEKSGLVIYPSAAAWKNSPDIELGATVHKSQVLLLMPELSKMQVTVGIHESVIDRVKPGLVVNIALADKTLVGKVGTVASVTSPGGWWTGNVVNYDTVIELPSVAGLKPGMSAEIEVIVAEHKDVLTIPVAAVVETVDGDFCWVKKAGGPERRTVQLGDSDDVHIVVDSGLSEGDEVILNPTAYIEEAQQEALRPADQEKAESKDQQKPAGVEPTDSERVQGE